jgi:misacylated tRNA(Ala) deacylase
METDTEYILNEHNKDEFAPAHTAEHLLNQTMIRMFGCKRSTNAHVERKKSKITYILDHKPSKKDEKEIERRMNELIEEDLPVKYKFVTRQDIPDNVELTNLPDDASETIRLVYIGNYDVCPCIGKHVRSTSQIGRFELLGTNWDEQTHSFRVRYKVVQ